ncbi:hypothetical protein ACQPYE_18570 [Actinosynnema sp. CA-299493]
MPLDDVELHALNVPDSPQARAHFAELTRPGGVELRPADAYEARDPTGSVTVTVDKARMVTSVRLRARWQDHLRPDVFPAALYNTYVTAVQRALAVELTHRSSGPPTRPAPQAVHVDPVDLPIEDWLARTRSRLDAIDDAYDEIRRGQGAVPPDVTEIRSPLGYLTLRLRGGGPIGIHGNAQALSHAADAVLAQDVRQLFGRAGLGTGAGVPPRAVRRRSDNRDDGGDDDYFSGFNVLRDRGGHGQR